MKVGIISVFPNKGSTHTGAIQGYTKNLAQELAKVSNVTVFTERTDECKSTYDELGVHIVCCWKKGLLYPFNIWFSSLRSKIDIFHIQHEYFLYGGMLSAMILPLLLLLLRLKAPVVITLHGIIFKGNVDKLLESNKKKFLGLLVLFILKVNLRQLAKLSNKIIVHNDYLKEVLVKEYGIAKSDIIVIGHGIEVNEQLDSRVAKNALNISASKIILFFGYLVKRKGLETLIEAFEKLKDELHDTILIIGAGETPRLKNDSEYRKYYNYIKRKAESTCNIHFVGFIPEDQLRIYISAANIIVFPYSVSIAASGALHISLGFNKIVLCSDIPIFKELLKTEKLLFRAGSSNDLYIKLTGLLNSSIQEINILQEIVSRLRNDNTWHKVSLKTLATYMTVLDKS
jgi:glycosyltransferase involved in cell wall biosynthesis